MCLWSNGSLLLLAAFIPGTISNAQRYALGATHVRVSVDGAGDRLHVEVSDDGRVHGEPASPEIGRGLSVLRTQAHTVGGELYANTDDGGFRVRLELPIRGERGERKDTITDDMFLAVDKPLVWSIRLCGVMVVAMSASPEALGGPHRRVWQLLNTLVAGVYEAVEQTGRLVYRPPAAGPGRSSRRNGAARRGSRRDRGRTARGARDPQRLARRRACASCPRR